MAAERRGGWRPSRSVEPPGDAPAGVAGRWGLRRRRTGECSIYLDPHTNDLFGYAEVESEERWAAIARTDVCRRWWRFMREIMPANGDDSPVSRELLEVFHLEGGHG